MKWKDPTKDLKRKRHLRNSLRVQMRAQNRCTQLRGLARKTRGKRKFETAGSAPPKRPTPDVATSSLPSVWRQAEQEHSAAPAEEPYWLPTRACLP
jgi:hypothetical protein